MIELFKHILHLDFDWLFAQYNTAIYLILFLVIFIETGLVLMPFLPGDSLLFTAGLFARTGHLNLSYILILLFIAAVVGDNVNYFIGKNIGLRMLGIKIRGKKVVKQEYLDKTHEFYEKHGTKTIIMARFVPIVRTFAPFTIAVPVATEVTVPDTVPIVTFSLFTYKLLPVPFKITLFKDVESPPKDMVLSVELD